MPISHHCIGKDRDLCDESYLTEGGYADILLAYRNEISGALSGLTRVRRFHQDDAHIFCRPIQIQEEIEATLEFIRVAYKAFKLPVHKLVLSTRPSNFIGTVEEWDRAEAALKAALDASGQEWSLNEGDGAFYGPKIDIILPDSDGKTHQTATIQLDFQLPHRFNLGYRTPSPEKERLGVESTAAEDINQIGVVEPVIIHRAVFGSLERFMALLIEHYGGRWPFWLSPFQAIIIPVTTTDDIMAHAMKAQKIIAGIATEAEATQSGSSTRAPQSMSRRQFRVDIDTSSNSLKKKILAAKLQKYNHIIVVGNKNVAGGTVTVNSEMDVWPSGSRAGEGKAPAHDLTPTEAHSIFVSLEDKYL